MDNSKSGAKVKKSLGDRIVDVIIYVVLGLIAISTILPFLYVFAGSFATEKVNRKKLPNQSSEPSNLLTVKI